MESYSKNVSMTIIRRLPKYYRYFSDLEKKGREKISSKELAQLMGLTASQIRQDLNTFGAYGLQGYGYNISELKEIIKEILGLNKKYKTIIIGTGNLGQALLHYLNKNENIEIDAVFDKYPESIKNLDFSNILPETELEEYLKNNEVDIAILTVPASEAQMMATRASKGGVKSILNFAPIDLEHPEEVKVSDVNISDSLNTLIYLLTE